MSEEIKKTVRVIEEKEIHPFSGGSALLFILAGFIVSVAAFVYGCILASNTKNVDVAGVVLIVIGSILFCILLFVLPGLRVVNPNEALVLTLFGKYYGTIKKEGFYYVNPFATGFNPANKTTASTAKAGTAGMPAETTITATTGKKISTKTMTLNNEKQKVNDVLGNPIIIGAIVIWRVADPTRAVFSVENYKTFLSIQCDTTIRNVARLFPYDTMEEDSDEKTLRGSSQEIANGMRDELQQRVKEAGLEIEEVRITHLSYAEEIAAAMLQRQQAVAVIAARQKIVEGAVGMVKMAIDQLSEDEVVVLDEERKAQMVSNLLVVLCGNKDPQPIVNSGSIY